MEIELKNGEKLKLGINSLILEYLEDYEGGIEQLKKDSDNKSIYATNYLLYAIIASNYKEELTYRQAIKLVKIEDVESIIKFVNTNLEQNDLRAMENNLKNRHRF